MNTDTKEFNKVANKTGKYHETSGQELQLPKTEIDLMPASFNPMIQ